MLGLTQANDRTDARSANGAYYENSIAHMVEQRRRRLSTQHSSYRGSSYRPDSDNLPPPPRTLGSNACTTKGKRVTGVKFEMWMSPNQSNMNKRLHDFTNLQTARDLPRSDPGPLENVRNWRSLYPCLAAVLDDKGDIPKFDIIMIETSYKMMSEFPPPKATLGLRLELDFGQESRTELFDWTCTTHIYRNGVPVKHPSYYRLEAKCGMVAPPFDSMWWALTFIDKVEQRKQAEETREHDAYHAAQERAQDFFSQLTAVHEIRARSQNDSGFPGPQSERGLVAVLLWKFSIAPETYVGTTSWQRLLAPPPRTTTNSPCPNQQAMSLPPLAMDTIVDSLHPDPELGDNKDLLNGQTNADLQDYHAGVDDSNAFLSHHDFEMTFKDEDMIDFAAMPSSFLPSTGGDHEGQCFPIADHFDYNLEFHGLSTPAHHDAYHPASNNIFESQHVNQNNLFEHHGEQSQDIIYGLHQEVDHDIDDISQRQPLASFDHNTHDMLQAQLAKASAGQCKQEDDDEKLKAALAAASAMSDLGGSQTIHLSSQPETRQEHLSALWEDISLPRPQLHTHPSSASHASYSPHHGHDARPGSAVNSDAFDANHIPAGFDGHEYNPSTSSPKIQTLLELHNHSFMEDDQQNRPLSRTEPHFANDLDGSFVLIDPIKLEQDVHE